MANHKTDVANHKTDVANHKTHVANHKTHVANHKMQHLDGVNVVILSVGVVTRSAAVQP